MAIHYFVSGQTVDMDLIEELKRAGDTVRFVSPAEMATMRAIGRAARDAREERPDLEVSLYFGS